MASAAGAVEAYQLAGMPAPDLVARGLTGENVRISEHRGEVVVVSFWSGSCNTCRDQLAALDRIAATYKSAGLVVIGVNLDDNLVRAEKFARSQDVEKKAAERRSRREGGSALTAADQLGERGRGVAIGHRRPDVDRSPGQGHVDPDLAEGPDHQVATAERFKDLGHVSVARDADELAERLDRLAEIAPTEVIRSHASEPLLAALRRLVASVPLRGGKGAR